MMPSAESAGSTIGGRPISRSYATTLWCLAIFVVWAAVVTVAASRHEFWRDEIRALSLALSANSLLSIPATIHGEGHPALWYLLLRASYEIFGTKAVLPILNLLIAAAAVAIFLWRAPFSLWWKALFVFSAIPAYEYSVMARNYGVAMLLMFLYAAVYTAPKRSPVVLAIILFMIAQTHIIATLLIPFYLFIWFADWHSARKQGTAPHDRLFWIMLASAVSAAGMLTAFATVYPTSNDLMLSSFPPRGTRILNAIASAILKPGGYYCAPPAGAELHPACSATSTLAIIGWTALLYLAVAGLAVRLPLLLSALGSLWGIALFFQLIYPGYYRHQAIWVVFLITLYWFEFARQPQSLDRRASLSSRLPRWSFYGALGVLLVLQTGLPKVYLDYEYEISKSRSVATLLQTSPDLRNAIIVPEPEQIAEAIPYHSDDDIYLLREAKFGKVATWSHTSRLKLRLRDLLTASKDLKESTGRPIVILLEYPITVSGSEELVEFSGPSPWQFSYNGEEAKSFLAATRKLQLGPPAILENFDAYLLR
jgi:hypothetical protein